MGCDVHAYIYYAIFNEDGEEFASNFAQLHMNRNYYLFGLLAGVRVNPIDLDDKPLLIYPRGLPKKNSYIVNDRYTLFVCDGDTEEEGYCSKKDAEQWGNKWFDEEHTRVFHPDWHTASYLYVNELEEIQKRYSNLLDDEEFKFLGLEDEAPDGYIVFRENSDGKVIKATERKPIGPDLELSAIIGAMKALNGDNPISSRLVFWFDN